MAISLQCPTCGKSYRVSEEKAGSKLRCKECGTGIRISTGGAREEYGNVPPRGLPPRSATPPKQKRKRRGNQKSASQSAALLPSIVGAVLMVGLLIGLGVWWSNNNAGDPVAVGDNQDESSTPPAGSLGETNAATPNTSAAVANGDNASSSTSSPRRNEQTAVSPTTAATLDTGGSALAISADGRLLSTTEDNRVSVFDLTSGEKLADMEQPDRYTWHRALALSPDGSLVASARHQNNRQLKVWESTSGKLLHQFQTNGSGTVEFSGDGNEVYFHQQNRQIIAFDLSTNSQRQVGSKEQAAGTVGYSPVEPIVAMGSSTILTLYDLANDTLINRLAWEYNENVPGGQDLVYWIEFSGDGRKIADAGNQRIRIRDARTLEVEARTSGGGVRPDAMALSTNGRFVAVVSGHVGVWDTLSSDGKPVNLPNSIQCRDMRFLSNGVLVLCFGRSPLRFVDPTTRKDIPFPSVPGMRIGAAID